MKFIITVITPLYAYTEYCKNFTDAITALKLLLIIKEKSKGRFDISINTIEQKEITKASNIMLHKQAA